MCKYVEGVKRGWKVSVKQGGYMVEADHIAFSFTSPKTSRKSERTEYTRINSCLGYLGETPEQPFWYNQGQILARAVECIRRLLQQS